MTLLCGADRLLEDAARLDGRRWALLAHAASVTAGLEPLHLALARSPAGHPVALFGPEHGYWAVEQDMVPSLDAKDPWTGVPVLSLYGDDAESLKPSPAVFSDIDVLVVDLQDVGARYYTYAATAVWAVEAALAAGTEVWVLDRPNPLGGDVIEGNLPDPGFESFVSAFEIPVRHGLTLAELVCLEAQRRGLDRAGLEIFPMAGWRRDMHWDETGRPWIPPSPNMPTLEAAWIYPGGCLIEATTVSEGRGTTRPFQRVGAPELDPVALTSALASASITSSGRAAEGLGIIPTYFRPQFQKHAGATCGGIEIVVQDPHGLRGYAFGVHLVRALAETLGDAFAWRPEPYEFVSEIPAIDLLTGGETFRHLVEADGDLTPWIASWAADEARFRDECASILLYPETTL